MESLAVMVIKWSVTILGSQVHLFWALRHVRFLAVPESDQIPIPSMRLQAIFARSAHLFGAIL